MYASISPDSRYVVSGSQDQTLRLWDLSRKGEMVRCFHTYGLVNKVGFCGEDNNTIAVLFSYDKLMMFRIHGKEDE